MIKGIDYSILKPCPFCGCTDIGISQTSFGPRAGVVQASVRCHECRAECGWMFVGNDIGDDSIYQTIQEAFPELARRWNRRSEETPTEFKLLEALKEVPAWFDEWNVEIGPAEETLLERVNAAIAEYEGVTD